MPYIDTKSKNNKRSNIFVIIRTYVWMLAYERLSLFLSHQVGIDLQYFLLTYTNLMIEWEVANSNNENGTLSICI